MNMLTDHDVEYMQIQAITVEDLNSRIQRGARMRHDLTVLIKDDMNTFVRVVIEDPALEFYYIQIV